MPVCDPELLAREEPLVAVLCGAGSESEGVGPASGLGEGIGSDHLGCQQGEVVSVELVAAPAVERVDHERVLHDQGSDGGVDSGELLHHQNRGEEGGICSPELLGHLDAHEAELEEHGEERRIDLLGLVHFGHEGGYFGLSEVPDGLPEHLLFVGQRGDGGAGVSG